MQKFIYFYRGGKPKNAKIAADRQPGWNDWFRSLGSNLVERGAPAQSLLIGEKSFHESGLEPTTGYSIVSAPSVEEAGRMAMSCPIYGEGGVVEVARYVEPCAL